MWLIITFLLIAAIAQAFLILRSEYIAIVLSLAALFFMLFHNAPVGLLMILIFIFPFSGTEAFKTAMADIPGFKPLQVFTLSIMIIALLNLRNAVRPPLPAVIFFAAIIALFSIAFLRSVPNLTAINQMLPEALSLKRYFLSEYFKPLIYIIPAVILTQYVHTMRDIERVVRTINWSITILSVVIIGFFFFNRNLIFDPGSTRSFYASSFGLHTNSIANYYIVGFPFILADLFRQRPLAGILKIGLCAVAIALLFSRSAYYIFILSFFVYLFVSRRGKWLPLLLVAMLAVYFMMPERVTERATKGFHSRDRNQIFAGRVDHIWLPLLKEITSDYKVLLFGDGRFAMVSTDAHKKKIVLQALHPHNMYLEMVLDAGLLGLCVFLGLFAYLLMKLYSRMKDAEGTPYKEYLVAIITSMVCFLVSGITDRTFFPDEINGYLWLLVGLAFVLCRHVQVLKLRAQAESGAAHSIETRFA